MVRAFVTGLAGPELGEDEADFIADADPFGVVLFRRNVVDPAQLRRLTDSVRAAAGRHLPVMVDQEGGRVQRLTAPEWRKYPSAARLAAAVRFSGDDRLLRDVASVMARDLAAVGIDVDFMPCLDLSIPGQSQVVGDRSYGSDPDIVAMHGRAAAEGMLAGGVLPVIKHMPGHGRSFVDSHHALPVVDASLTELEATCFRPFRELADLPAGMTSHLLYLAIDQDNPATQSERVITDIIRGHIGFDGLLFSDDLSMNALSGSLGERASRALAAGVDVALHCNGVMEEMRQVAAAAPPLAGKALARAEAALSRIGHAASVDVEEIVARLERALADLDRGAGV